MSTERFMKQMDKVFYTLMLIGAVLPFIFPTKVHPYYGVPDSYEYSPNITLWLFPFMLGVLFFVRQIWDEDIKNFLRRKLE